MRAALFTVLFRRNRDWIALKRNYLSFSVVLKQLTEAPDIIFSNALNSEADTYYEPDRYDIIWI